MSTSLFSLWCLLPKRRRKQLIGLLVLILTASICELLSLGAIIPFLGALFSPESVPFASEIKTALKSFNLTNYISINLFVTILFIFAATLAGIVRISLVAYQMKVSYGVGSDLSLLIYENILQKPYIFHIETNTSDIIDSITTKTYLVVNMVVMPLFYMLGSIIIGFSIILFLTFLNSQISPIIFLVIGVAYLALALIGKKYLLIMGERVSLESSSLIRVLQEALGGIREVILNSNQEFYVKIYKNSDSRVRQANANINIISLAPRYLVEVIGITVVAIIAYKNINNNSDAIIVFPMLVAIVMGAQRILPLAQQLYSSYSTITGGSSILSDILKLAHKDNLIKNNNQKKLTFQNQIDCKNISFKYSKSSENNIKNISLRIKKGDIVGVVGKTGCGKSTFIDLIMGLLPPNSGNILLDGVSIYDDLTLWKKEISHVPQSIFLTDSTVIQNIAFGEDSKNIDINKIIKVCRIANIADEIEAWPLKYETVLGERGVRLSGGQKQRIGIARALYKNSKILILDEATSALDIETEAKVIQSIKGLHERFATIIIAHRISTLSMCNVILKLDNGRLEWIGSYEELIEMGLFNKK